jgi:hypothetical protein
MPSRFSAERLKSSAVQTRRLPPHEVANEDFHSGVPRQA